MIRASRSWNVSERSSRSFKHPLPSLKSVVEIHIVGALRKARYMKLLFLLGRKENEPRPYIFPLNFVRRLPDGSKKEKS
jgi:hypothetical protein